MNVINEEGEPIDWKKIIANLQAFTRKWVEGLAWFRGGKTNSFAKGKGIDDYVSDAIEKYLRNPENFNPKKGDLVDYLKFNLIRSMVSNDLRSKENRLNKDVFSNTDLTDNEDSRTYLDSILPFAEALFDQEIDYKVIMEEIEIEVSKDKIAEEIYLGERSYNLKRSEIIAEFNMSEKEFDNGKRRMQTMLNKIANKYDLNKPSA